MGLDVGDGEGKRESFGVGAHGNRRRRKKGVGGRIRRCVLIPRKRDRNHMQ